jgi:hypothetical protein
VAVEPAVSLFPAELDRGLDELHRQARTAVLWQHGQPFQLGKFGEIPDADAARRLVSDIADEMRAGEIVSVEFFGVGAVLLGDVVAARIENTFSRSSNVWTAVTPTSPPCGRARFASGNES